MTDDSQNQPHRIVWPGIGLVMGAGVGSVVGLLIQPDLFFVYGGAGAGTGLVIGAIAQAARWRSNR